MRIKDHPVLDFGRERRRIAFTYEGETFYGYEGDTIAAALIAAGVVKFRESLVRKRPRGLYCAIGNCSSCHMIVNGEANIKTCITPLEEGLRVEMQKDRGRI
ncbi:MAG TPA: (2Fe-2S)-binding protein [Acholeplasmataceae bacterium]|nr:(2Fe-2S)-binding protein [Acholeplasmataceae bacterium]